MADVVVTAPHSACAPGARRRTCDLAALRNAEGLRAALEAEGLRVRLIESGQPRAAADDNRVAAGTPFWEAFRQTASPWVLDVHSFPPDTPGWAGRPVLMLHPAPAAARLPIPVGPASKKNSVVSHAWRQGRRVALLEFNEGMPPEGARARGLHRLIAAAVATDLRAPAPPAPVEIVGAPAPPPAAGAIVALLLVLIVLGLWWWAARRLAAGPLQKITTAGLSRSQGRRPETWR